MHGATHATKATQRTNAQMHKNVKKQKKCYKNMQKYAKREITMAFKKTMATFQDEQKGGPTTIRDPLKWDPHYKTRQGTQQNETHTTQFM